MCDLMPIYGKGKPKKKGFRVVNSEVKRKSRFERQFFPRKAAYRYEHSHLSEVEKKLGFPLKKRIAAMIRFAPKGYKPVVVDWGCGGGKAAISLGNRFGESARIYGFSHLAYRTWLSNDKVKFVHAPAEDFKRYFKENSVDLIYSHFGLYHQPSQSYLRELARTLRSGGKIVANVPGGYSQIADIQRDSTFVEGKGKYRQKVSIVWQRPALHVITIERLE